MQTARSTLAALLVLASMPALAQSLPPASRTVFKCVEKGKVVYSDSPCLGAQRIDVEPTRGLNKSSGTERVGADVRQERHNELIADALRPVLGETAEQRAKRHRRAKLGTQAKTECADLDNRISAGEAEKKQAAAAFRKPVQGRLLALRGRFKELQC